MFTFGSWREDVQHVVRTSCPGRDAAARHIHGPVFAEHDYNVVGKILAIGTTPKTEYLWYESELLEPADGRQVAKMLMMLRFMKASSTAWSD